jgi:hypothetical protein
MVFFVPPQQGSAGAPGPPGPPGPADNRYYLRFTHGGGVPSSGTQYLRLGVGVFSSEDGDLPTADYTIRGISISVDAIDAAQTYDVEVLSVVRTAGAAASTFGDIVVTVEVSIP